MAQDPRYSTSMTVDVHPDTPKKNLRAFDLVEADYETELAWHRIQRINDQIDEIKGRISTEQLPANYVEKLKQRIAELEASRVPIALGREYE